MTNRAPAELVRSPAINPALARVESMLRSSVSVLALLFAWVETALTLATPVKASAWSNIPITSPTCTRLKAGQGNRLGLVESKTKLFIGVLFATAVGV